jgi:predicted nucleotidyltransferase
LCGGEMSERLDDLEGYRTGWRRREQVRRLERAKRRERAWRVAACAAWLLKETFGVRQVWAFGSLVRDQLDERSDIDLAVVGLAERDLCRAVGRLQALDPEFPIDVVRLEDAPPSLRRRIEREGVLL